MLPKSLNYFEKFFELTILNETIKFESIKVILTLINHVDEYFHVIEKAAVLFSEHNQSLPYSTIVDRLKSSNKQMNFFTWKLLNIMFDRANGED